MTLGLSVRVAWLQVIDRGREQEDRRMTQARLITAWVDDSLAATKAVARVVVRNSSGQAVYDLIMALDVGLRGTYAVFRNALGPGDTWDYQFQLAGSPRADLSAPTLRFVDASGLDWIRTTDGKIRHSAPEDFTTRLCDGPGAYESVAARDALAEQLRLTLAEGDDV